jgi:hypothetical protein
MELIVKYDDRSLAAAAKTLFLHRWHPLVPWIATCLTMLSLTVGATSLVLRGPVDTTVIFLSLGILSTLGSLTGFALHRRRVMRRSGEVARLELGEHVVRVDSASGSAEIPWKSLVQIDSGLLNVFLYVSRGVAVVIPTGSIPAAAMELLERKRLELGSKSAVSNGQRVYASARRFGLSRPAEPKLARRFGSPPRPTARGSAVCISFRFGSAAVAATRRAARRAAVAGRGFRTERARAGASQTSCRL